MKKAVAYSLAFCALLGVSTSSFAEFAQENSEMIQETVPVTVRPLSAEKQQLLETKRKAEEQSGKEVLDEQELYSVPIIPIRAQEDELYAIPVIPIKWDEMITSTAGSYSPHLFHWIDEFPEYQDNLLQMEDGTQWLVCPDDAYVLRDWHQGDTIVITPKGGIFSSDYSYCISNKTSGSWVNVNPAVPPIKFGQNSCWITGMDTVRGQVHVTNGRGDRSSWVIHSGDMYLMEEWNINDHLIFGENDSWLWWFSSYSTIVINASMNHYVRARQI